MSTFGIHRLGWLMVRTWSNSDGTFLLWSQCLWKECGIRWGVG